MPPKRKRKSDENDVDGGVMSTAAKKPKKAPKNPSKTWKMPPPLPDGEVLTDFSRNQWKIGGSVGKGGFGEIYLASPTGKNAADKSVQHVIKVEPHENGPLFTELSFYRRVAKPDTIDGWVKGNKVGYLPVPKYIGSGAHESKSVKYRFMVMERFGDDVEKLFNVAGRQFGMKTVCYIALRLLEALEYLHSMEYVHADIKGSNLLVGHSPANRHKVYLVDYGLAYRFHADGVHREYKPDPRRSHDGTIEFTSIDAHDGANPSRRGDLEILGYCLIQWASGNLPWMGFLQDKPKVAAEKKKYKSNPHQLLVDCFNSQYQPVPKCLKEYMKTVYCYGYQEEPDYSLLKKLFVKELKDHGWKDSKDGLDWLATKQKNASETTRKRKTKGADKEKEEEEEDEEPMGTPPKQKKGPVADDELSAGMRRSPRLALKTAPVAAPLNSKQVPAQTSSSKKQAETKSQAKKDTSSKKKQGVEKDDNGGAATLSQNKSPRKKRGRKRRSSSEWTESGDDQAGDSSSGNDKVSPSKRMPKIVYPTELGYKNKSKAETFGSLAEKKKRAKKI